MRGSILRIIFLSGLIKSVTNITILDTFKIKPFLMLAILSNKRSIKPIETNYTNKVLKDGYQKTSY